MSTKISRNVIEHILMGPERGRRFTQDSPILPDVWFAYGKALEAPLDLLITPFENQPAPRVASCLSDAIQDYREGVDPGNERRDCEIAALQGVLVARLYFDELIKAILPMTAWWDRNKMGELIGRIRSGQITEEYLTLLCGWILRGEEKSESELASPLPDVTTSAIIRSARFFTLFGVFAWVESRTGEHQDADLKAPAFDNADIAAVVETLRETILGMKDYKAPKESGVQEKSLIHLISRNRDAEAAIVESVPAIKADAARHLFNLNCSAITWAILDSGIDATHEAFRYKEDDKEKCRVRATYDFSKVRQVLSINDVVLRNKGDKLAADIHNDIGKESPGKKSIKEMLRNVAKTNKEGRATDWNLVGPLIRRPTDTAPLSDHGTHVAGILGAGSEADDATLKGVCPDINLYDFRVIGPSLVETEFAIMAALQYIRFLNQTNDFMVVHGANLSLSIPHDVENYACGRTPICDECERLSASGVVVVAAAGNRGYQRFETGAGYYESYAAFSITDPGNAEKVITVGATHRYWPHTYGVSYFSSRGPTGDGRMKPDLVAPGEKITGPLPNNDQGPLDGTSMAAPHVSGAAAMLMARYSELIGNPERIKKILCDSATDLGRERSFQGHGMLDVLRAMQSI